jgi:3-hydroxyisobutyrate dehydrogenase
LIVGFIGLGMMGSAAARNILKAGFKLVVHDSNKSSGTELLDSGADWAESPAACAAAADVVVTMVPGPKEIEAVVRGANGLMAGARKGLIWVDMTTNRPSLVLSLAAELAKKGVVTIDSPVTGAVDGAIGGRLTLFAGGVRESVEKVRPILESMGTVL